MLAHNNNLVIKDVTTNGTVEKCPSLGESSDSWHDNGPLDAQRKEMNNSSSAMKRE